MPDTTTSRRTVLAASAGLALAQASPAHAAPRRREPARFAYVGCYTTAQRNGHGTGITAFRVNGPGRWERLSVTETPPNPSFLTLDRTQSYLYAVHGDHDRVSAYAIDRRTGLLTALGSVPSEGTNPVHLTLAPDNRYLLVANYATGTLSTLPRAPDGRLRPATQVVQLTGTPGPDRSQQTGPHPHHIPFAPDGHHVHVPDKGTDRIHQFAYDAATGILTPAPAVVVRSGSGPRHIAHHPRRPVAYVVDELNSQVTTYDCDPADGTLTPRSWLPTLPSSFTGDSTAAEIQLSHDARFLFLSNRGHDSLAVYPVSEDGTLRAPRWTPAGGRQPRFFTLDPTGATLYAANQASDTIAAFETTKDGRLHRTGTTINTGSPVCIAFRTR
ncbi:lactonase family protein [Streptomyces sp. NPDC044989]|uniref:lactonase family protein n=1 Tax=Streptomyces sp. NPDC044989 TaxID=3154336 RepID=UPI0034117079